MKSFLALASFSLRIVRGSAVGERVDIVFGSFGEEESAVVNQVSVTNGRAIDQANDHVTSISTTSISTKSISTTTTTTSAPFVNAVYAPVRGDRLNELKKVEQYHRNRFMGVNAIPGRLNLRLSRDHFLGSLTDYSLEALFICLRYLEIPAETKECELTKKRVLKTLFEMDYTAHQGLEGLKNSFLHPLCYDAMKLLGDALQPHQIAWLLANVPEALFENFELLTGLKDYSFIGLDVYERLMMSFKTSMAVDYLALPAFVKTAQVPVLMMLLASTFEPSRHWNILMENRSDFNDLIKDESVISNPRFYPFLVGVQPLEYIANASKITAKIRTNGLTSLLLASLLAYVQESNDLIQFHFTEIAQLWADLHKNAHLQGPTPCYEEFNERSNGFLNNLLYLRDQREEINALIEEFEQGKIPAHPAIVKESPDWCKWLKVLVQTPFNLMVRGHFATRCSYDFLKMVGTIHPDDEANVIKLPRLTYAEVKGFNLSADPAFTFSPLLWSAMWRNVFFTDGEEWRTDAEIQNLTGADFEEYLKPRFEVIYRDSKAGLIDLMSAWMKLSPVLPETFSRGPRLLRFIAAIAVFAPPDGFDFPKEKMIERKVFAKKVVAALKDVRLMDKNFTEYIKFALRDSEEVVSAIEGTKAMTEEDGPIGYRTELPALEQLCEKINSMMNSTSTKLPPKRLFNYLKLIETSFATLGKVLSEEQIEFMGKSVEINKFLGRHGRALTRTQVKGLIESEVGRKFLKANQPMLRSLIDYSAFKMGNFEELGLYVDDIRINLAGASSTLKLVNLARKGFSSADDPLALVYSFGLTMWTDTNLFKSFALWELLNPLVLAYDLDMTADGAFIYHMTGLKHKLHSKVLLELALIFVVKWLIAQDWYAFIYHVAIGKGAETIGANMITRLKEIYPKYLSEGELPGRNDMRDWLQGVDEGRTIENSKDEGVVFKLAGLSVAVDAAPLTPFREIVNQSDSNVSALLAKPFTQSAHSPTLLAFVQSVIQEHFKPNDKMIWASRLEILSQFSVETGKLRNDQDSAALTRFRLRTLPNFDALIYKWALELEGVCVESIFRDDGKTMLEIDSSKGIVPKKIIAASVKEAEPQKQSGNNKKKNNKKKK